MGLGDSGAELGANGPFIFSFFVLTKSALTLPNYFIGTNYPNRKAKLHHGPVDPLENVQCEWSPPKMVQWGCNVRRCGAT